MNAADHEVPAESPIPSSPPFIDRGTASFIMGLLVVLIGFGCLGMVALVAFGVGAASAMAPGQATSFRTTIPAIVLYLAFAVFFLTTGVGAATFRRWARALLSVVSWMWLAVGGFALVLVLAILPQITATMEKAAPPGAPAPPAGLMVGCMLGALIFIYVAIPLPLALFFSGKNVRATFEARDRPRWTDRLPAPLLGLLLVLAFSAFSALQMPLYGAVPAFGKLLSGAAMWVFVAVFAGVTGAGAWWVWHRSILGWWAAVAFWIFGTVSTIWTFAGGFDWNAYYTEMGLSPQQIRMTEGLSPADLFANPFVLGIMALAWLGLGAVLFWTQRFFAAPAAPGPVV